MKKCFVVIEGEGGCDEFDTEALARAHAEKEIAWYREQADDEGWSEDVENVMVCRKIAQATAFPLREDDRDSPVEYALEDYKDSRDDEMAQLREALRIRDEEIVSLKREIARLNALLGSK